MSVSGRLVVIPAVLGLLLTGCEAATDVSMGGPGPTPEAGVDASGGTDAANTTTGRDSGSVTDPTDGGSSIPDSGAAGDYCGNGADDNGDGRIDEGCTCTPDATQGCWNGPIERRNLGICRDGTQTCASAGEFMGWGECTGATLPGIEIPGNGVDEDCDGADPMTGCVPAPEQCDNSRDDDCDGVLDCQDSDCAGAENCNEECTATEAQFTVGPTACKDARDNDCDGLRDCADPDCRIDAAELFCDDAFDDDCDGLIDCFDPDCADDVACSTPDCECISGQERWCDTPTYCSWGKQVCMPDGNWGACIEVFDRPFLCTGELYNTVCCVLSGQCCQDWPFNPSNSVGNCDGITCR